MMYKIERMSFITREYVRQNPDKLFLFGDNLLRRGFGGQAREMRGEPNAIGIPTKKRPARTPDSYFTDEEFEENIAAIDQAISYVYERLCESGEPRVSVIPSAGLGTGRSELQQRAPRTFAYLELKLTELVNPS